MMRRRFQERIGERIGVMVPTATDMRIGVAATLMLALAVALLFLLAPTFVSAQGASGPDADRGSSRLLFESVPDRSVGIVPLRYPMTTDFGTYVPYRVPKVVPSVGRTEGRLADDLSNLRIAEGFAIENLSSRTRGLLVRDRVATDRPQAATFGDFYNGESGGQLPDYVTFDAALYGLRASIADAYDEAIEDHLYYDLDEILASLSRNLGTALKVERDRRMAESLGRLLAWIETGRTLLDPDYVPVEAVAELVAAERTKVDSGEKAKGLFGRAIDYGLFAHGSTASATNADAKVDRYRSARRWVARTGPDLAGGHARSAALLARIVDQLGRRDADHLDDLVTIENFFVGSDNSFLTLDAIAGGMRSWFGFRYDAGYRYLAGDDDVGEIRSYLARYRDDAVAERMQTGLLAPSGNGILDRFDDKQELVALLKDPGATAFGRFLANRPAEEWVATLDDLFLSVAASLLEGSEDPGFPAYMRSRTWKSRRDARFLGHLGAAATERLMLDDPVTSASSVSTTAADRTRSVYVEPDPIAWAHLASAAGYLRRGLTEGVRGTLVGEETERRLRDIETTATRLMAIAVGELEGRPLTDRERDILASLPARIAAWEGAVRPDGSIRLVAGMKAGESRVLEHPRTLYVALPDGAGGHILARGAILGVATSEPSGAWQSMMLGEGTDAALGVDEIRGVEARIVRPTPSLATATDRMVASGVRVDLESSIVRRSSGAVWYTLIAEGFNRVDVTATVIDGSGRTIWRSSPMTIDEGERYDMIPTETLRGGTYFVRISDIAGTMLASGRFVVVR